MKQIKKGRIEVKRVKLRLEGGRGCTSSLRARSHSQVVRGLGWGRHRRDLTHPSLCACMPRTIDRHF